MPDITFTDGKRYHVTPADFTFQFMDTGDRYGNTNIRFHSEPLYVHQALRYIDPALLTTSLAAAIDGEIVPLSARIKQDCRLAAISDQDAASRAIYHRTLGFLLARILCDDSALRLLHLRAADDGCVLQFSVPAAFSLSRNQVEEAFAALQAQNSPILLKDLWQKDAVIASFPSLTAQPYNQTLLDGYDDYECVPVVGFDDFVLIAPDNAIYATLPAALSPFTWEWTQQKDVLTLSARHA